MSQRQPTAKTPAVITPGMAHGHVIHHRRHPRRHRFKYHMSWHLIDLAAVEQWSRPFRLWKHNGLGLYSLYDKDYINEQRIPIRDKLSQYVQQQTGQPFNGAVYLFTHPRFLGYGFNSVNFYFCYVDEQLTYIVSEINNTPWGEKHLYFHDCAQAEQHAATHRFEFDKAFHISPFMSMNINYCWDFNVSAEQIAVKMVLHQDGVNVLNVVLDTKITPLMENGQQWMRIRRPFQPWKMAAGIYWQALKLWVKKVPFYSHPNSHQAETQHNKNNNRSHDT